MNDVQERLVEVLRKAAGRLRASGLPGELAERMEALAGQVGEPCVVAVVGRVKVGKSTFVNALLGEDLAKVGTTETTATINYFSYLDPGHNDYDPERPVRCHWRGGNTTDETRAFLDSLQGKDLETLRLADGIDHLEYFVPNLSLKDMTLVDTPGTGAVVDEHEDRTAEFMRLSGRLRERHDEETRRLGDTADAVIYLVGQVAKADDAAFLQEFGRATGGRSSALNAIGVLSKVEVQPEVMARRHELSRKISTQLEGSLNTVLPVAAGLRRELDKRGPAGLERLLSALGRIPPARLRMLLNNEEFFTGLDFDDCPVGAGERRELLGDASWGVFTTMARAAVDSGLDPGLAEVRLEEECGFGPLWEVLRRHFIDRGHILRCYRILGDARKVLNELRYDHLPQRQREALKERARLDRFLGFIGRPGGDAAVASELEDFVRDHLDAGRRMEDLEQLHADLDEAFGILLDELKEYNEDFEALQKLAGDAHGFSAADLHELEPLLGKYGGELERRLPPGCANPGYVGGRQRHWNRKRLEARYGSAAQAIAEQAFTRYGLILDEILARPQ